MDDQKLNDKSSGQAPNARPRGEVPSSGVPNAMGMSQMPAHIQEQYRRQIQAQGMMFAQQQMMYMQQAMRPRMPARPPPMTTQQHHSNRPSVPSQRLALLNQVIPFADGMDEATFFRSLTQFLSCVGMAVPKSSPTIAGRPLSLFQLLSVVVKFGGYIKTSETRRWPAVAVSLGFPPNSAEILTSIHSLYGTFLHAYEQFMIFGVPAESIQWPPALMQSIQAPQPQAPPPQTRLASASAPKQPQSNGPATPVPSRQKPMVPGQPCFETYTSAQWKSLKALRDPFQILRRGRYNYRELCLNLESEIGPLVYFALNQLQAILLDSTCPSPDPLCLETIVKSLVRISTDWESTSGMYLWELSRLAMTKHLILTSKDQSVLDLISNVLRCIISRPDCKDVIEKTRQQHNGLSHMVVALLSNWTINGPTFEIRKNAFICLSELSPGSLSVLLNLNNGLFFKSLYGNLDHVLKWIMPPTIRILLGLPQQPPATTEALKQHIMNRIQATTNFFKTLPPLTFSQLEILYKVSVHLGHCPNSKFAYSSNLLSLLVEFLLVILPPTTVLVTLITNLMEIEEFRSSEEFSKWFQKIVHSSSFGLPDLGYLELILLNINSLLVLVEDSSVPVNKLSSLILSIESIRRLWLCDSSELRLKFDRQVAVNQPSNSLPRTKRQSSKTYTTVTTDKSPLLWQSHSSTSSHIYEVYLLLMKTLTQVVQRIPQLAAPSLIRHFDIILHWSSDEPALPCKLSRDVLYAPDLKEKYALLLDTAIEYTLKV